MDGLIKGSNYLQIGCKNNKRLAQLIYWFTVKSMHEIIKGSIFINYLSNITKGLSIYNKYIVKTIIP